MSILVHGAGLHALVDSCVPKAVEKLQGTFSAVPRDGAIRYSAGDKSLTVMWVDADTGIVGATPPAHSRSQTPRQPRLEAVDTARAFWAVADWSELKFPWFKDAAVPVRVSVDATLTPRMEMRAEVELRTVEEAAGAKAALGHARDLFAGGDDDVLRKLATGTHVTLADKRVTVRVVVDETEFAYRGTPPVRAPVFGFFVGMALMGAVEKFFR